MYMADLLGKPSAPASAAPSAPAPSAPAAAVPEAPADPEKAVSALGFRVVLSLSNVGAEIMCQSLGIVGMVWAISNRPQSVIGQYSGSYIGGKSKLYKQVISYGPLCLYPPNSQPTGPHMSPAATCGDRSSLFVSYRRFVNMTASSLVCPDSQGYMALEVERKRHYAAYPCKIASLRLLCKFSFVFFFIRASVLLDVGVQASRGMGRICSVHLGTFYVGGYMALTPFLKVAARPKPWIPCQ